MIKSNQKGTTMMEAIAAISVVTVMAVGVIKLIGGMFESFKQNMIENEIQEVQKRIVSRYRLEGNYANIPTTVEKIKEEQLVPAQMYANNKLIHRQNGEVTIATSTLGSDYFDVTFKGLSVRSCVNLSQINWNNGQNSDLLQLKINTKTFVLPVGNVSAGDDNALPMTMQKAVDSCKSGDDNVIIWTFQ